MTNPQTIPAANPSEWGEQLASFAPTRVPVHLAILNKSLGMLVFLGGALYDAGQRLEVTVIGALIGSAFAIAAYRMATRHKRPDVVVYENGIWCRFQVQRRKRKFYRWDEIKNIEQLEYNVSPTTGNKPGFLINFKGETRRHAVYQFMDRYTEIYRIFYQRKILNADSPLQLFDIDVRGYVCANRGWYTSLYYPDKNKIVQFKGRPIPAI